MQLALWNKTAISWWVEFIEDQVLAFLSESHFKKFLLSEITFFLVFYLCETATENHWMGAEKRNQLTRSKEYSSGIKIFLAGSSCIIEITSCNKLHRRKLPEFRFITSMDNLPMWPILRSPQNFKKVTQFWAKKTREDLKQILRGPQKNLSIELLLSDNKSSSTKKHGLIFANRLT